MGELITALVIVAVGIGGLIALLPYFVSYILVQPGSVFTLGFVVLTVASILATTKA